MSSPPRIHDCRTLAKTRIFTIEEVDLEFSNGEQRCYERVTGSEQASVLIIPITQAGELLLIREFGAGSGRYELGLPKGRIEAGEDPLVAAQRELMEEVGQGAHSLRLLRTLSLVPGYIRHETHLILAEDLYPAVAEGDEPEPIEVVPWPLADLDQLLAQPDLTEARSIAALLLAERALARPARTEPPILPDVHPEMFMYPPPLPVTLADVVKLAEAAGRAILDIYQGDFAIEEKSDQSPLTSADLASHRTILAGLAALTPDIPVLSEESAVLPFKTRRRWSRYWLVDPLDGTKEFIKRNGEFTVNIALVDDHRPILGVVHAPALALSYYCAPGQGAWKRRQGERPEAINVQIHHQSPVRVVASRSHRGDNLEALLERLGAERGGTECLSMGSSLKLCLVAEGAADLYPRLGPTSEWDTAAAQAIVEAAGGMVTDCKMLPMRYNTKESLLNAHFLVFGDRNVNWSHYL